MGIALLLTKIEGCGFHQKQYNHFFYQTQATFFQDLKMTFDLSRSSIKDKYFVTFASSYKAKSFVVEYRSVV